MNDNNERFLQVVEFLQTKWDHHVELTQTINGLRFCMYEQCILLLKMGKINEVISLLTQLKGSIYDDDVEET